MKRNKLFLIMVLVLVFALAMSVLLVGCDNSKKDKDDDEDEETSKPKAEEIFKGVDTTDFDAVKERLFEKLDGKNFTADNKMTMEGITSNMTLKVTDKAMHMSTDNGNENILSLEDGKTYQYVKETKNDDFKRTKEQDGYFDEGITSQIEGSKSYIAAFTSSDVNYNEETKEFSNDTIKVKVDKTSVLIIKQVSGYISEVTFRDFGATRVKLPSKYSEEVQAEIVDIWGDVDRTDYRTVRAKMDEIILACTAGNYYEHEIEKNNNIVDHTTIFNMSDAYVSVKRTGKPILENYFLNTNINGKDVYAAFAQENGKWLYTIEAEEHQYGSYTESMLEMIVSYFVESFNDTMTYDADQSAFVAENGGVTYTLKLTPDGFHLDMSNGFKIYVSELNTAKLPALPDDVLDYARYVGPNDEPRFPNIY